MQHPDGSCFLPDLKQHLPTLFHLVMACWGRGSVRTRAWGDGWRSSASPHSLRRSTASSCVGVVRRWCSAWELLDIPVVWCQGCHRGTDLNMSPSLRRPSGGFWDHGKDVPTTVVWMHTSKASGEALLESSTINDHDCWSPSLRCIRTTYSILKGLQQENQVKIHVELLIWVDKMGCWERITCVDASIRLAAASLSVDTTYR